VQLTQCIGEARPFVVGQAAGTHAVRIQTTDRGQHTHGELGATHFHGEHGHRQTDVYGHVFGNVQSKGGVVCHDIVVGDIEPHRMAHGDALAFNLAHRFNTGEVGALLARPGFGQSSDLL